MELETDFDRVWAPYPRKVGKAAARKAFEKIAPNQTLVRIMLDAIAWQRTQAQWTKDGGQYIPHLSTWLNQKRWEDERPQTAHAPDRLRGLREFING